jgi:hypothetical protein
LILREIYACRTGVKQSSATRNAEGFQGRM